MLELWLVMMSSWVVVGGLTRIREGHEMKRAPLGSIRPGLSGPSGGVLFGRLVVIKVLNMARESHSPPRKAPVGCRFALQARIEQTAEDVERNRYDRS